jgi:hypothetical protein
VCCSSATTRGPWTSSISTAMCSLATRLSGIPGELALEPLERDRVQLDFFPPDREDDFFVVDRLVVEALLVEPLLEDFFLVVVEPPERALLRDAAAPVAAAAVGGDGVAGGALAAAVRVRPPGAATSTPKPSSASAMSAPNVIASAAARPRKMPTFRVGEPATIREDQQDRERAQRGGERPPPKRDVEPLPRSR